MNNYLKQYYKIALITAISFLFAACAKDEYYVDGGKAEAKFNGNILEFLNSKPVPFDSVAQIVVLAGMEETFKNDTITFFAPTDLVIKQSLQFLNIQLFSLGKDTIKALSDVSPVIWKKYLSRYIMDGTNILKDYPQIDFDIRAVYPGMNTFNLAGNELYNIGVVYNDQNSVKYIGYRQLAYSFIPDRSKPLDNWMTAAVATSDIRPTNGVVHALAFTITSITVVDGTLSDVKSRIGALPTSSAANLFGFGFDFIREVVLSK